MDASILAVLDGLGARCGGTRRARAAYAPIFNGVPVSCGARRARFGRCQESFLNTVLQTHHLEKRFGGITATHDKSISFERGARHALIGPNGAGKTTLVNLLTGVLTPTSGTIVLDGEDIT